MNEMTVLVEGRQFLRPQVYILYFLLQIAFMLFFHYFMKKHSGGIDKKSLLAISISFFIIEVLMQTITIAFHKGRADWFNLNIELAAIVVAMLFVILLVYIKNYLYLREQEQRDKMQIARLQQQFAYYQEKMKDEERVRSIYHDLKNHLLVMESRQNTEETRQMAETLRSQIADYEDYVHTGNEFLDIILKDKAAKAREKQIDFSAMVDFHGIDFMEALDISTIFGNAIDNAIEASENLPEYKRLITVKAERIRDMLLITIENNTLPGNHLTDGTTKKDRFVHGFGIPNIKKAVEKYGGQCSFQQEESVYRLKILIPCP